MDLEAISAGYDFLEQAVMRTQLVQHASKPRFDLAILPGQRTQAVPGVRCIPYFSPKCRKNAIFKSKKCSTHISDLSGTILTLGRISLEHIAFP